jgi:hypothetical protein
LFRGILGKVIATYVPEVGRDVLSESMIRELTAHRGDPIVTSFYLDVDGRTYPRPSDLEPKIAHLYRVARHEAVALGGDTIQAVESDLARIGAWLSEGLDRRETRGVAAFSCAANGFFSTFALPVSVADEISLDRRPHVAPLLVALEAAKPCLVVLADHVRARLLRIEDGEVSERAGPFDEIPRQVDTDVELGSFSRHDEEALRRHLRSVADAVEHELRLRPVDYLILGGPAAAELEHHLRGAEVRRVDGRVDVAMTAPRDEVAAAGRCLLADLERRRKAELVGDLLERAGAGATLGFSSTLDALAERRVATLVVGRGLKARGVRCRECGQLGVEPGSCPRCGGTLDEVADLVEAAIAEGLGEGASVEFVDAPELDAAGGMGSIERY